MDRRRWTGSRGGSGRGSTRASSNRSSGRSAAASWAGASGMAQRCSEARFGVHVRLPDGSWLLAENPSRGLTVPKASSPKRPGAMHERYPPVRAAVPKLAAGAKSKRTRRGRGSSGLAPPLRAALRGRGTHGVGAGSRRFVSTCTRVRQRPGLTRLPLTVPCMSMRAEPGLRGHELPERWFLGAGR